MQFKIRIQIVNLTFCLSWQKTRAQSFQRFSSCKCLILIYCINFITLFNRINMSVYFFLYTIYSFVMILRRFATLITNVFFSIALMLFKFFTIISSNITVKWNMCSNAKINMRISVYYELNWRILNCYVHWTLKKWIERILKFIERIWRFIIIENDYYFFDYRCIWFNDYLRFICTSLNMIN